MDELGFGALLLNVTRSQRDTGFRGVPRSVSECKRARERLLHVLVLVIAIPLKAHQSEVYGRTKKPGFGVLLATLVSISINMSDM